MKQLFSKIAIYTKENHFFNMLNTAFCRNWKTHKDKFYYCIAALMLSFLGWLFPDVLWDENTVSITDENGQEVVCEYTGEELEDMISKAQQIEYKSKLAELVLEIWE